MERALLEGVEEADGLGGVGGWRALRVVRAARCEGRRDERGGELSATRHAGRISLRCPGAGYPGRAPAARGWGGVGVFISADLSAAGRGWGGLEVLLYADLSATAIAEQAVRIRMAVVEVGIVEVCVVKHVEDVERNAQRR